MLRSIRWTLQLWHAAILALAVVGIGLTGYFTIQQARYKEIDAELIAAGQVLVSKLHGPVRPPDGPNGPNDRPPPGGYGRGPMNDFGPGDGFGGPPPEMLDRDPNRPLQDRLPRNIELPPGFMQRYAGNDPSERSFVIFSADHTIIKSWGAPYDPIFFRRVRNPRVTRSTRAHAALSMKC